jgi:hypothetical protein
MMDRILEPHVARTNHKCNGCGLLIHPGEPYIKSLISGAGLDNIKFPDYYHEHCCEQKETAKGA